MKLCAVEGCIHHRPDCARGDDCECSAALAAPGLRVCPHHADQPREQLRELPELWAVLGSKPSNGSHGGRSTESPAPISDRAILERLGMKVMLVTWAKVLEEDRGSPLPDERKIAARTRQDIVRHDSDARMALAVRRAVRDDDSGAKAKRTKASQAYYAARQKATAARGLREDDRDIIEALREHLDRHLSWLLNSEHAGQLVYEVDVVHHGARRVAYPGRATIRLLCECGMRVPISTAPEAVMACPGCGDRGTLAQWREREAPADDGPLSLRDLADWLYAHCGLIVSYEQLRNWSRSDRAPHMIPAQEAYRDEAGILRPAKFDPEAVAVIAQHRLGKRATA